MRTSLWIRQYLAAGEYALTRFAIGDWLAVNHVNGRPLVRTFHDLPWHKIRMQHMTVTALALEVGRNSVSITTLTAPSAVGLRGGVSASAAVDVLGQ